MTKWERYEQEKAEIAAMLNSGKISYDEYERRLRELCRRLGV